MPSARLRASTSSSGLRSSSACASASFTMRSISASVSPELDLMVILFSLPLALSLADTCRMPLASMSKVTSICGTPRGAAGGLDAEPQRGHVQQQHILHFTAQDAALNGSAHRHRLVRVHVLARLLAE